MVIQRKITNLNEKLKLSKAPKFTDLSSDGQPDKEAQRLLHELTDEKIPAVLQRDKWLSYTVEWEGHDGIDDVAHRDYLFKFCQEFYDHMRDLILDCYKRQQATNDSSSGLVTEILQHANMCRSRCQMFSGRQEELMHIREYLMGQGNESQQAIVVHGVSGCGKTSLLAMAAKMATEDPPILPVVILRFLGK